MSDYLLPYQPSLASATNTRVDTAARHMQQCRVSTDDMMRLVKNDSEELTRNKFRYCVHKDELAVGVGRPWDPAVVKKMNNAYPRILSNLGALDDDDSTRGAVNMIRYMNHFARNLSERKKIIRWFQSDRWTDARFQDPGGREETLAATCLCFPQDKGVMHTKKHMPLMHDFHPVGYATTLGFAHPNTGDTMCSVLIGGLITVMNGDFEIFTGDPVQFYWCFEKDDFERDGRRREYINVWTGDGEIPGNIDPSVEKSENRKRTWTGMGDSEIRRETYELSYGQARDKRTRAKLVAKIKPYYPDDQNPRLFDWYRIFGIAISSARPNEMVDIKISRQSM